MAAEINTQLKIPDLWYDFYSRFLPGVLFIAYVRYFLIQNISLPTLTEILILIFLGYSIALFTQPICSQIKYFIQKKILERQKLSASYIKEVQLNLGNKKRPSMILSKMGGEMSFFIQIAIFSFISSIINTFRCNPNLIIISLVVVIISLLFSIEVGSRRVKRA